MRLLHVHLDKDLHLNLHLDLRLALHLPLILCLLVPFPLFFGSAQVAMATHIGNMPTLDEKGPPTGARSGGDGREGGETIDDAFPIPSLPFLDTGNICDNINDYEEMCPFSSMSPDVVYAYVAAMDGELDIDLCTSLYDTKVFVYEEVYTQGVPHACNDDFGCGYTGYQSRIYDMPVTAGLTYFIVVDGYANDCGEYELSVRYQEPCVIDCPPGATLEGEPPLVTGYVDQHNSGCGGVPPVWQTLEGDVAGHLDLCGSTGTYLLNGSSTRDTDWFIVRAGGDQVIAQLTPESPAYLYQLSVDPTCLNVDVLQTVSPFICETGILTIDTMPGEEVWLWVSCREFHSEPEFSYLLTVDGLEHHSTSVEGATRSATWGAIKGLYQ